MQNDVVYKNWPVKDFAAGVLSVWSPLISYDPIFPPPPLHTVPVYTVYCTYSHREGGDS